MAALAQTPSAVGERLKIVRELRGLSQHALSLAAHLSGNKVHQIEKGAIRDPGWDVIAAIVEVLRCNSDVLVRDCSVYWDVVRRFAASELRRELQATDDEITELMMWPTIPFLTSGAAPTLGAIARGLESYRALRGSAPSAGNTPAP